MKQQNKIENDERVDDNLVSEEYDEQNYGKLDHLINKFKS